MVKKDFVEIRIHGRGGQGAWTASRILAEAALLANKYAQSFPEFGPERSGAPVTAFARIGDSRIDIHSAIYNADIVILLDPTLIEHALRDYRDNAVFLFPTVESAEEAKNRLSGEGVEVWGVDAIKISVEELGRGITNTTMLGAFVKATKESLIKIDHIIEATERVLGHRLGKEGLEKNIRAIKRAYEETKRIK